VRKPNVKIPIAKPDIGNEEIEAVVKAMKSGWITQGKKVEEFEKSFANYCGAKYGIATSSGTTAIHTALASIGVQNSDEVITTPLSCVSTANPPSTCLAIPSTWTLSWRPLKNMAFM